MLEVTFLNAQTSAAAQEKQATSVAKKLAAFIEQATLSLHIAIYDFRLSGEAADAVIGALNERAKAGVSVRVAYFEPRKSRKTTEDYAAIGADPAPGPDLHFLNRLDPRVQKKGIRELGPEVESEAIDGMGHLMHDKYVIRDGMTPQAALWTGSANFTDDAFSLQENNIVVLQSRDLCDFYETDFGELWSQATISSTGKNDTGTAEIGNAEVTVYFAPGEGRTIDHEIASRIAAAKRKIRIASMVISSAGILGALVDALDRGVTVTGIYDGTEMDGVEKDWAKSSAASKTKLSVWTHVKTHLVAKYSHPYTEHGPHDFMHNKFAVIDEASVVTGSFNFSNNAARNAENVLVIEDKNVAQQYAAYADRLIEQYQDSTRSYADGAVSNAAEAEAYAKDHPVTHTKKRRRPR